MPTATVTSKGQITIPVKVRKAMGLKPGTRIDFYQNEDGRFVLYPKTGSIKDLEGCLAKFIPPGTPPITIEEIDKAIGDAVTESYLRSVGELSSADSENEAA